MLSGLILMGGASICASLLLPFKTPNHVGSSLDYEFVLSEIGPPLSFDPLEADYTNNLHASQMLHQSLLEVTSDNSLNSGVLKEFSYDPESKAIALTIDDEARFSDGTPIQPEDIAMTIRRMAARRPTFPVLRHIRGIAEWSAAERPLTQALEGIQIKGNTVVVTLTRDVKNPLYRFALPIYGLVKSDCVNLTTNKLKPDCPTSGYYRLAERKGNTLLFEAQSVSADKRTLPSRIQLKYLERPLSLVDLAQVNSSTRVVFAEDHRVDPREVQAQRDLGFTRQEQPNSRFSAFLFNPRNEILNEPSCRLFIAKEIRKRLKTTLPLAQLESSIFNQIVPGYLAHEELEKNSLSIEEVQRCRQKMMGRVLRWMPLSAHSNNEGFEKALRGAAEEFGIQIKVLPEVSRKERFQAFESNQLDIVLLTSGFWPFDPIGDVQMLFTKNLHKQLQFLSSDHKLQRMLSDLEFRSDPVEPLKAINRYLYENALFNVYAHSKRVYLGKGPGFHPDIAIAITPPAPWQVFHVDRQ